MIPPITRPTQSYSQSQAVADKPTPENTPVPGGGSWHWTGTGWAENSAQNDLPAPAALPAPHFTTTISSE